MRDWIPKSEALKKAAVSAFDAKRYLSSFSQFIPSGRPLIQGGLVSPRVPEILSNFKMMEKSGLSMEQIEQAIAGNLAQGRRPEAGLVTGPKCYSIQVEANRLLTLINLMKQLAENQENIQVEILKLIQCFEEEMNALHTRIAKLEKNSGKP